MRDRNALQAEIQNDFDLEIDLEREELIILLDRAMTLLPPDTRRVLVEKYVRETLLIDIARQMGLNPNAVAAHLHRGKLALKGMLETDLREGAISFVLIAPETARWALTRQPVQHTGDDGARRHRPRPCRGRGCFT